MQKSELGYIGFRITRQGIIPLPDKVEVFKNTHSSNYY